jgi:8-oxo-dGTP pyrophosphatase MutT (NUDIX family)
MNYQDILSQYPDIDINTDGGPDTFRPDEPIIERDPIAVIIKHPTDDAYLVAKWKNADWCGLLTGGIEEGDSIEETVRKEIQEETGFTNIKTIRTTDCVSHGLFYHTVKHVNRLAHYHLVIAELADLSHIPVSEEELAIAEFVWVEGSRVREELSRNDMKVLWDYYIKIDAL